MIQDPLFYLVAIPAILIMGLAKGGMGGGLGIVSVPLMSLAIPPAQAAAILLPILCVMDLFGVWGFRGIYDRENLKILLPAGLLGVVVGALSYSYLSEADIKLLVGVLALLFTLNWLYRHLSGHVATVSGPNRLVGRLLGALAGFTSFSVHAGGPPIQVYLLSQQLDKTRFQATSVAFFFVVNWLKLPPYYWLGQLDLGNVATSLVLVPLAPVGIVLGTWLHHRIDERWFFRVVYATLLIVGSKLIYDGVAGL